ncbi:MAG: helix-turn-helix transcriptional regulator [Candidatus Sumerlaeota bacterium]|nr:helix-turn-helix transcriptional regulator [Candidatus Sumerlaeota bacterium]
MGTAIAQRIYRHRKKLKLTQDELGSRYSISGPAVFKFEKGYVVPSLDLWLRLAEDMNIDKKTAVLMHVQDKLPEPYKAYCDWESLAGEGGKGPEYEDFTRYRKEEDLRQAVAGNQWLPAGLCELAQSKQTWTLYRPTAPEVNILRDIFAPLGEGTLRDFCDALRLVREFRGA